LYKTIGFDINQERAAVLTSGQDKTRRMKAADLQTAFHQPETPLRSTAQAEAVHEADIYIVTVPT